ncbi:MAG: GIN domain-containing protein [Chitinophagales bacterium]
MDIAGSFNVYVQQGDDFNVTLVSHEGDDKLEKASVKRDGNTLEVSMNNKWSFFTKSSNGSKLDLHLTMPELSEMELTGTSHTVIKDFNAEATNIEAEVSGASTAHINVVNHLDADLSGASQVLYVGEPTEVRSETSGAAHITKVTIE